MANTHEINGYTVKTTTDNGEEYAFEIRNNKGQILAKGAKWSGHRGEDAAIKNARRFIRKRRAELEEALAQAEDEITSYARIPEDERTDEQDELISKLEATVEDIRDELGLNDDSDES